MAERRSLLDIDLNQPPVVVSSPEIEAPVTSILPSAGPEIPNTDIPGPSIQESPTTPHTAISTALVEDNPPPTIPSPQEETQENPKVAKTDIAGPSYPSSPPTSTIQAFQSNILHFKLKADTLRKAISPLADPDFNPEGFGSIKMSNNSFNINVCNNERHVKGRLSLFSTALSEYSYQSYLQPRFRDPMIGKISNVRQIFENLKAVEADDIVAVFYPMMSTQLFFKIGDEPTSRFSVELLEPDNEVDMFPKYWSVDNRSEGFATNAKVKQMIRGLSCLNFQGELPQVSVTVDLHDHTASIKVGRSRLQEHGNIQGEQHAERTHNFARFNWYYTSLLRSATNLKCKFYVRILGEPRNCIIMRLVYDGGLGTLMLMTNAVSVDLDQYAN